MVKTLSEKKKKNRRRKIVVTKESILQSRKKKEKNKNHLFSSFLPSSQRDSNSSDAVLASGDGDNENDSTMITDCNLNSQKQRRERKSYEELSASNTPLEDQETITTTTTGMTTNVESSETESSSLLPHQFKTNNNKKQRHYPLHQGYARIEFVFPKSDGVKKPFSFANHNKKKYYTPISPRKSTSPTQNQTNSPLLPPSNPGSPHACTNGHAAPQQQQEQQTIQDILDSMDKNKKNKNIQNHKTQDQTQNGTSSLSIKTVTSIKTDSPSTNNENDLVNSSSPSIASTTSRSVQDAIKLGRRPRANSTDAELNLPQRGLCDEALILQSCHWLIFSKQGSPFKKFSPRGFENLGNTCFLNATLQCLLYLPTFAQTVLQHQQNKTAKTQNTVSINNFNNKKPNNNARLVGILQSIFHETLLSKNSSKSFVSPQALVRFLPKLGSASYQFRRGRQEDAHEFLVHLLDKLQTFELQSCGIFPQQSGWRNRMPLPRLDETTFVHRIFGGYLRSQITCTRCKQESNTYDPFLDLSLEISSSSVKTLHHALTEFTKCERLDKNNAYKCRGCKTKVCATKQLTVFRPPLSLCIQLKRFSFKQSGRWHSHHNGSLYGNKFNYFMGGGGGGGGAKISKPISFPFQFDLPLSDGRTCAYHLTGIVVHHGSSATSGHYTAYCKDPTAEKKANNNNNNDAWLHLDDAHAQRIPLASILKQQQCNVYLLFYTRSNPPKKTIHPKQSVLSSTKTRTINNGAHEHREAPQMVETPSIKMNGGTKKKVERVAAQNSATSLHDNTEQRQKPDPPQSPLKQAAKTKANGVAPKSFAKGSLDGPTAPIKDLAAGGPKNVVQADAIQKDARLQETTRKQGAKSLADSSLKDPDPKNDDSNGGNHVSDKKETSGSFNEKKATFTRAKLTVIVEDVTTSSSSESSSSGGESKSNADNEDDDKKPSPKRTAPSAQKKDPATPKQAVPSLQKDTAQNNTTIPITRKRTSVLVEDVTTSSSDESAESGETPESKQPSAQKEIPKTVPKNASNRTNPTVEDVTTSSDSFESSSDEDDSEDEDESDSNDGDKKPKPVTPKNTRAPKTTLNEPNEITGTPVTHKADGESTPDNDQGQGTTTPTKEKKTPTRVKKVVGNRGGNRVEVMIGPRRTKKAWIPKAQLTPMSRQSARHELLGTIGVGRWDDEDDDEDDDQLKNKKKVRVQQAKNDNSMSSPSGRENVVKQMNRQATVRKRKMYVDRWDAILDQGKAKKVKAPKDSPLSKESQSPKTNPFQRIQTSLQRMNRQRQRRKGYQQPMARNHRKQKGRQSI